MHTFYHLIYKLFFFFFFFLIVYYYYFDESLFLSLSLFLSIPSRRRPRRNSCGTKIRAIARSP